MLVFKSVLLLNSFQFYPNLISDFAILRETGVRDFKYILRFYALLGISVRFHQLVGYGTHFDVFGSRWRNIWLTLTVTEPFRSPSWLR